MENEWVVGWGLKGWGEEVRDGGRVDFEDGVEVELVWGKGEGLEGEGEWEGRFREVELEWEGEGVEVFGGMERGGGIEGIEGGVVGIGG